MNKQNRIFLVGHSGAGKGILAEKVAEKLGWANINLDYALEPAIGRSMVETLGEEGEKRFLNTLTNMLQFQTTKENRVVITDDAIVLQAEARKILTNEFTVFIEVSLKIQYERLSTSRPYLPVENYSEYLESLRSTRNEFYKQVAHFSLNSDDGDIDKHVDMIIQAFSNFKK